MYGPTSSGLSRYHFVDDDLVKFNPHHVPKGSPQGGEFAAHDEGEVVIPAWHGSAKEFKAFGGGEFRSGSGSNDYGKGHYFAAGKKVAQQYKKELAHGGVGRLYQVEIKVSPSRLLQWDKPMAEQSAFVRAAMTKLGVGKGDISQYGSDESGRGAFHALTNKMYNRRSMVDGVNGRDALIARATDKMAGLGLQGVRYRDEGAFGGNAPSDFNYVIYDPKRVTIVKMTKVVGEGGLLKFNPLHVPAGSSTGGQFAPGAGDGLTRDAKGNIVMPNRAPPSGELQDLANAQYDKLSEDELAALFKYTGTGYIPINRTLRGAELQHPYTWDIKDAIQKLDSVVDKASLPKELTVYRGVRDVHLNGIKPGDLITDKGFISTSTEMGVAFGFGTRTGDVPHTGLFKIQLPTGSHAALATGFSTEQEVILPRDSVYRVTNVEKYQHFANSAGVVGQMNVYTLEPALAKAVVTYEMDSRGDDKFAWDAAATKLAKFNLHHQPAGSAIGGQFAAADGDGMARDAQGRVIIPLKGIYASDELRALAQKHYDAMTQAERDAYVEYVDGGDKAINNTLRGRHLSPGDYKVDDKTVDVDGDIQHLDKALDRSTLPKALTVYRGGGDTHLAGMQPGDLLTDKGYLSTSAHMDVAFRFGIQTKGISNPTATLFKIDLPAGSHAALARGFDIEHEVLLPRNSTFRVTSVQKNQNFVEPGGLKDSLNVVTLVPVLAKAAAFEMDGGANRFTWGRVRHLAVAKAAPRINRKLPIGFQWDKHSKIVDEYAAVVLKGLKAMQQSAVMVTHRILTEHLSKDDDYSLWSTLVSSALDTSGLDLIVEATARIAEEVARAGALAAELQLASVLPDGMASHGLATVGLGGPDGGDSFVNQSDPWATEWARTRSAELVGRRYNAQGTLVPSNNAAMRIDETTRTMVREIVYRGLRDERTLAEITEDLMNTGAFGEERAHLIAATEIARAHGYGQLHQAKVLAAETEIVLKKYWMVADTPCPICDANHAQGLLDLDVPFVSGDDATPGHPNCRCALGLTSPDSEMSPEEIAYYNDLASTTPWEGPGTYQAPLPAQDDHDDREAVNLMEAPMGLLKFGVDDPTLVKFNENHNPAGDRTGGQFSAGGALPGDPDYDKLVDHSTKPTPPTTIKPGSSAVPKTSAPKVALPKTAQETESARHAQAQTEMAAHEKEMDASRNPSNPAPGHDQYGRPIHQTDHSVNAATPPSATAARARATGEKAAAVRASRGAAVAAGGRTVTHSTPGKVAGSDLTAVQIGGGPVNGKSFRDAAAVGGHAIPGPTGHGQYDVGKLLTHDDGLLKFNPHHDDRGEFSSEGAMASFTHHDRMARHHESAAPNDKDPGSQLLHATAGMAHRRASKQFASAARLMNGFNGHIGMVELGKAGPLGKEADAMSAKLGMGKAERRLRRLAERRRGDEATDGLIKFNPAHHPAGTAVGGQFAPKGEAGSPTEGMTAAQKAEYVGFDHQPNLSPEDRKVEGASIAKYIKNKQAMLAEYQAKQGTVVNVDEARKQFKDVGYNGRNSAAVQEASSALGKDAFREALKGPGKLVTLYAGGSGSGKSSAVKGILPEGESHVAAVLDGNLSKYSSATQRIQEVVAAGKDPHVVYVYRDPSDAWEHGVIARANNTANKEGGRIVPMSTFLQNAPGSLDVVRQLKADGVHVTAIDNSLGRGKAAIMSDERLASLSYPSTAEMRSTLTARTKELLHDGKITEEQYHALVS